jgi:penicillin amidase
MRAKNWEEFISGVDNWNTPGLVFSFADIKGNIGIAPRGLVPLRSKNIDGRIVNPYWRNENTWIGFIQPSELPTSYNPTKNFVIAANNGVLRDTTKYIASTFSLASRVKRFYELTNNIAEYTYRDAQIMQKDIIDVYAKELLKKLEHIFKKYKSLLSINENIAYNKLTNWDYSMQINSTSASIFNMFLSKMIENTFADELDDLYASYIYNPNVPMQKLLQLCTNESNSVWFDNIKTTDKVEQLNYITITSFKDAIAELTKLYGTDNIDKWQYGKFHRASLNRNFDYYPAINPIINMGTYSIGGDISTINCAEWDLLHPFEVVLSSTMRFIADMSSDNCYTIILGGISGDAMNSHYANQISFFNIGAYSTLSINRKPDERFKIDIKMVRK